MKLTSEQVARTINQFEVQAIPDSHPAILERVRLGKRSK